MDFPSKTMCINLLQRIALVAFILSTAVTSSQLRVAHQPSVTLPQGKRFAVLFRGQAFRSTDGQERFFCSECVREDQLQATQSLVDIIFTPLEEQGNTFEVILTEEAFSEDTPHRLYNSSGHVRASEVLVDKESDSAPALQFEKVATEQLSEAKECPLMIDIKGLLKNWIVASASFPSTGQGDNIRQALDAFNSKFDGDDSISSDFDYVLVLRYDLLWKKNITETVTDFDKFNFFAHCEPDSPSDLGGPNCVWDQVHLMPAIFYPVFNSVVGSEGCFQEDNDAHAGHPCKNLIDKGIKRVRQDAKSGFITPLSVRARAHNDYLETILPRCAA